jgi:hypothetical protein
MACYDVDGGTIGEGNAAEEEELIQRAVQLALDLPIAGGKHGWARSTGGKKETVGRKGRRTVNRPTLGQPWCLCPTRLGSLDKTHGFI